MRKCLLVMTAVGAWAAMPLTVTAVGSLAAISLLAGGAAKADTALRPGWRHSCGRDPRCFERGEARRMAARLRAPPAHTQ